MLNRGDVYVCTARNGTMRRKGRNAERYLKFAINVQFRLQDVVLVE